jgi:hypothetical protein
LRTKKSQKFLEILLMDEKEVGTFERAHNASEDYVGQYVWRNAGVITTDGELLTANQHLKATAEGLASTEFVKIDIPPGTVSIELRVRGFAKQANDLVTEVYAIAGDDWYIHQGTVTWVIGTAVGPDSTLFAKDATLTNAAGLSTIGEAVPATAIATGIARIALNAHGYTDLYICASTIDTGTGAFIYVDWRKF